MGGLLGLLVPGVLFCVMKRFGCGAHMVNGRGLRGADRDGRRRP